MSKEFDELFNDATAPTEQLETTETANEPTPEATPEVVEQVEGNPVEEEPAVPTGERKDRVPVDALQAERAKRQEKEREIAELRQQIATQQQPQAPKPNTKAPDPYDDPQGFYEAISREAELKAQQQMLALKLNWSEQQAKEKYGEETVAQAVAWAAERAANDPAFERAALSHTHPAEYVIQQHNRHTRLAEFETDPDAFVRRRAQELGLVTPAEVAQVATGQKQQEAARNQAPKSLASVTSNSKATNETNHGAGFDALFR